MSSVDAADGAPAPTRPRTGFFDLPTEVQRDIVGHCSQGDLICCSLVSKAFRELAAAQLYRNFHIVFPDEDDPSYDSPIDGLAGGLDTFVTSDYDYAKHLRDLALDTLSAGDKAETAYKPYLYSVSCGKFLNTLLYLTLKKAKSLETFRWNIRVELSRQVYQTLHQIDTLRDLHLRLQAGPSMYETPPPLPLSGTTSPASSVVHLPDPPPPPPPPPIFSPPFNIPAGAQVFYVAPTSAPPPPPPAAPKPAPRSRPFRKSSLAKEPPTLSGFKNLKSLSVLDIDSLDIITELKSCVRNSAGTLTKLQLSFSDYLGSQARKPPPDLDPEDSDLEDDLQGPPPPPVSGFNDDSSGPARAFRAQEERKSQEAVLGRIFDVDPYLIKQSAQKQSKDKQKADKSDPSSSPGKEFIASLTELTRKLMKEANESDHQPVAHQDLLDLIEEAARKYVDSDDGKRRRRLAKNNAGEGSPTSSTQTKAEEDKGKAADQASDSGLFATTAPKPKESDKDGSPEDINIEEPLEQLSLDVPESTTSQTGADETPAPAPPDSDEGSSSQKPPLRARDLDIPGLEKAESNLEAQRRNFKTLAQKLDDFETQANGLSKEIQGLRASDGTATLDRLVVAEKQMQSFSRNIHEIQTEMSVVEAEIDDAEKQISSSQDVEDKEAAQKRRMTEYMRSTRGLPLQTLDMYLIPVKASVLHKAIDIRALRRITLLNVGPQGAIWTLFHKENKESPLALREIFTDNVSTAFLNCVSSLEEVHDLFLLERDNKYKPESFAPKTSSTISQIRRLVLKKHMGTLRRLMVKNQLDHSWDFDEKTFSLICGRGQQLEELACSTSIKAVHIFMRKMARLVKLRALHIISLRNDDTCVWVMRETKEFLLDNLSHHPEMKLEWVSIDEDDKVDRILMPAELQAEAKKKKEKAEKGKGKGKGKGKQKATNFSINGGSSTFPVFPPLDGWDVDSDSDDDDGDDDGMYTVETVPGVHFYDVWDVTIFKKEVVYGRL